MGLSGRPPKLANPTRGAAKLNPTQKNPLQSLRSPVAILRTRNENVSVTFVTVNGVRGDYQPPIHAHMSPDCTEYVGKLYVCAVVCICGCNRLDVCGLKEKTRVFSNNPITNRTITNWGKGRRVMGVNPLTITPLRLPLDPIAPSRPYTSMGLCWCGVTRHPNHQPAPPATG